MKAIDAANYIINEAIEQGKPVTNLKLQKMLFQAQLEAAKNDCKLIDSDFEAWQYGPVSREVYSEFAIYSSNDIDKKQEQVEIKDDKKKIIDAVIASNIDKNTWDLVEESHVENGAWDITIKNKGLKKTIDFKDIQKEAKKDSKK
ncbi:MULTISPECIES: Panacea domain-containing protein [unclassified Campylobacter]|uniref:Panacea domain-containing protein n=1 Tax=unclassified Campylobacter TaxID=2593542 RepID=UPI001DC64C2E|nr:DUF4065 domain-containing protein [Campylobacter sp. RM9331]MBZ8006298.1 DUF4065 domain-containing protein [Campylobacter sp. RM9332]